MTPPTEEKTMEWEQQIDAVLDKYTGKHDKTKSQFESILFGDTVFARRDLLMKEIIPIVSKALASSQEERIREKIEKIKILEKHFGMERADDDICMEGEEYNKALQDVLTAIEK